MPLLPLRDIVIFPYMVVPLFVGRERSVVALEKAILKERLTLLCTQKKANVNEPLEDDIYKMGTISEILQLLKLPDGTTKVLIEGIARARVVEYLENPDYFYVKIKKVREEFFKTSKMEALMRMLISEFEEYIKLNPHLPSEAMSIIKNIDNPGRLADVISAHLNLSVANKQEILELVDYEERIKKISTLLNSEIEILGIEKKIQGEVRKQIEKSQKEYYLHEQIKAIQKELGKGNDSINEIKEIKKQIKEAKLPKEVEEKSLRELSRLEKMPLMSAEGAVIRNYLSWVVSLPWSKQTKDKIDIDEAEKILEKDHYGLKKAKERIIEYLAVQKLVKKMKGSILCFTGPPGTGKTSVAKSIAKAMGRKFVRLSLGGVRDEAEIRGHRMTYVAALPGRIIQSIRKAGSKNPVFLLDEVDKMSTDFRGDPSSALLEVLDPEQNSSFSDHYLEVPFDLSDVMFITTANVLYSIPIPLQDRMEVLEFPSYTEEEKKKIAEQFLIPKQVKAHGLKKENIKISLEVLTSIVGKYTREAGVRNLERELATLCRKVAKDMVKGKNKKKLYLITEEDLVKYLGPSKFKKEITEEENKVGVVTGLAWTSTGGDILTVEATLMPGRGNLILTGQLGEVMKESAQAALSYARSNAKLLNIDDLNFYKKSDLHIHFPEGAIPKDGPSAGITMVVALVSLLVNKAVNRKIAMTGEVTLRGRILAIGGIKEKILAAHRANLFKVIIPKDNEKNLIDVPKEVLDKLEIILVENVEDVLKVALIEKEKILEKKDQ
ncbi:endopeptidase La [bacterium]|nr:endopeptidase La [bacterium]MBU1782938.1 endopeptidase La [bacterium]